MNWFDDSVVVVAKAASNTDHKLEFYAPTEMTMLGSLLPSLRERTSAPDGKLIRVESERLDDRLDDFPFVDMIKIDVEGGEAEVLDGMKRLLADHRVGLISMEYRLDAIDEVH